jgi:hypothetical protein
MTVAVFVIIYCVITYIGMFFFLRHIISKDDEEYLAGFLFITAPFSLILLSIYPILCGISFLIRLGKK